MFPVFGPRTKVPGADWAAACGIPPPALPMPLRPFLLVAKKDENPKTEPKAIVVAPAAKKL